MSKRQKPKSADKSTGVKLGKLARPERELKNAEAEKIRGGGGAPGGVLGGKSNTGVYGPRSVS
jgi:hypothetical protein